MSANGQRPQAIIFDWDNTLINSWPAIHDALNFTLEAFGLEPWSMEQARRRVRKSLRDSFPALFGDCWEEAGEVYYRRFSAIHLDQLRPTPGATEMLEELNGSGVYLAVVSNKKGDFLRMEAAQLGWEKHFGGLVGATDASRDKPACDPVDMALSGSGVSRGPNVWFAGDADIDMECAVNAGCVPVLVRPEPPEKGEFNDYPPLHHFDKCVALSNFIRRL